VTGPLIAVCDYGIGNLHSAQKALAAHGADARLTADRELIADAAAVVLPGVGAFGACMSALRATGLETPVLEAIGSGRPFLGICIGTQMLFDDSEEAPGVSGLGVIPGTVRRLPPGVKHPQMQWNQVDVLDPAEPMFAGLDGRPWFYFVHSLHGVPRDPALVVAMCDYGGAVNAAFRRGNVFATQFHPEKSAADGRRLFTNFVTVATDAGALV
jgi:glutamine amidotransferase